jgi:site-specific DNA-methyltransferase (adenine-specific)
MIYCGDCLDVMKTMEDNSIDSIVVDPPYGIRFMGKKWDYDMPTVEVWKECLRVLKPGGHILTACGTRTQHRMAVNIEDAGFEIRDLIAWVYGSGFPKSLNIGKQVDKLLGNGREIIGKKKGQGNIPNDRGKWGLKPNVDVDVDLGESEWEGWGTGLKPAMELWTLARKPISEKTIVENVLKWGVGGINIDGCKIGTNAGWSYPNGRGGKGCFGKATNLEEPMASNSGRWPANLIHDGSEEVLELFPSPHGAGFARYNCRDISGQTKGCFPAHGAGGHRFGDHGSVARFFYCAKASNSERNYGLDGVPLKKKHTPSGDDHVINEICPTHKKTLCDCGWRCSPVANYHPTVKPIKLMRYLCRLITPPNGVVLDPYMGSGTTGIACKLEGFNFIGIEKEQEYVEIAKKRITSFKLDKENKSTRDMDNKFKQYDLGLV